VEKDYDPTPTKISAEAIAALKQYQFPGNVRELENILERAFALCEDGIIYAHDLSLSPTSKAVETQAPVINEPQTNPAATDNSPEDVDSLESYLEDIEKNVIVEALEATRWNKTAAAKKLGITFRALRYRLKKLDLE